MKTFKNHFDKYACEGDSITAEVGRFTLTARLYRDDCADAPDQRQDGFWPSLDPKSAGYIGPKSKATLARHTKRAQAVMDAWKNDEWFYCGVAVTAECEGVALTDEFANALWGIECNYPVNGHHGHSNAYLLEVANDLAEEALADARDKLKRLARHSGFKADNATAEES